MPNPVLGILGGGQLGSLLSSSAKKLNVKTFVFSDDKNAPAKNFCDEFILGKYNDEEKIKYLRIYEKILSVDEVKNLYIRKDDIPFCFSCSTGLCE